MDALKTLGVEVVFIPQEEVARRARLSRSRIALWIGAAGLTVLVALATAVPIADAIRASRRENCAVRLKRLAHALSEYHDVYGHYPAPAFAGPDGTPLLSWRVAILPYMGYRSLYNRFHLDEPWDSPHNLALLGEMPAEFACPAGPGRRAATTGYLVIVGPVTEYGSINTPFEPGAESITARSPTALRTRSS